MIRIGFNTEMLWNQSDAGQKDYFESLFGMAVKRLLLKEDLSETAKRCHSVRRI